LGEASSICTSSGCSTLQHNQLQDR
jgi:hypothetical protein